MDLQIDETAAIAVARQILSTNNSWSGAGVTYRATATEHGYRVMVNNNGDLQAGSYRIILLDKYGKLIRNTGGF